MVVPFNESWLLAGRDEVDLVATNVASFPDRVSEGGTFSAPFLYERRALRIHPEDKGRFEHIDDFVGRTVGVVSGMAAERDVDRRAPEGVIVWRTETFMQLYEAFDAGEVDAIAEAEYYSLDGEVIPSHGDEVILTDPHDKNPGHRHGTVLLVLDKLTNLLTAALVVLIISGPAHRPPRPDPGSARGVGFRRARQEHEPARRSECLHRPDPLPAYGVDKRIFL